MAALEIQGLTKAFGPEPVLRGVDLSVDSGRLVAILGASGSGKTTLLRLLCGFETADSGSIRIGGKMVSGPGLHVPPERRNIGYVAQEGALFPHLSVADNIVFGLPRAQRRARHRVAELLEMVGLPAAYGVRPPQALSGGEQQRVAVARALAPNPAMVLLDEPFSGLDAALRAETRQAVAAALSRAGATALLVTHDQAEALSMGHAVAVLRQGVLVQVASPERLYRHPVDPELARFVGDAVLLPGVAKAGRVCCTLGHLPLSAGMMNGAAPEGEVEIMIRPEQIRLVSGDEGQGASARVSTVTYYGLNASVRLTLSGGGEPVALTALVPGHQSPRPGDTVGILVEGDVMAYVAKKDRGNA